MLAQALVHSMANHNLPAFGYPGLGATRKPCLRLDWLVTTIGPFNVQHTTVTTQYPLRWQAPATANAVQRKEGLPTASLALTTHLPLKAPVANPQVLS